MNRFALLGQGVATPEMRARLALWRKRLLTALRISTGAFLIISAGLSLRPEAIHALTSTLERAAYEPGLAPTLWHSLWHALALSHPTGFAWGCALVLAGAGMGLLLGALTNLACALGMVLAIISWSTASLGLIAPLGDRELAGNAGIALIWIFACWGLSLGNAGAFIGFDSRLARTMGNWSFLVSTPNRSHPRQSAIAWQPIETREQPATSVQRADEVGRRQATPSITRERVGTSYKGG